jgi:hypothetical protein
MVQTEECPEKNGEVRKRGTDDGSSVFFFRILTIKMISDDQ